VGQALKELKSEHRVLLSGTPLQNNIAELFMLLHFLDKAKFGNLEEFEDQFKDLSHEKQVGPCVSPSNAFQIGVLILEPFGDSIASQPLHPGGIARP